MGMKKNINGCYFVSFGKPVNIIISHMYFIMLLDIMEAVIMFFVS